MDAAMVADEVLPTTTQVRVERWGHEEDTRTSVSWFGNLLWIWLGGGLLVAAVYFVFGLLLICTIVLAPFGLQLIKLGKLALFPFGKHVDSCTAENAFESLLYALLNVLWIPVGVLLVLIHVLLGILCACTCYGIVFSLQHLKLAQMALFPFGSRSHHHRHVSHETLVTSTTSYNTIPTQGYAAAQGYATAQGYAAAHDVAPVHGVASPETAYLAKPVFKDFSEA